jgi:hypothetical protein
MDGYQHNMVHQVFCHLNDDISHCSLSTMRYALKENLPGIICATKHHSCFSHHAIYIYINTLNKHYLFHMEKYEDFSYF